MITKVHNKFKNNNKNGNFTFKCCYWPIGVFSVPSECLSANNCWLYLCCLLDQDLKGQRRLKIGQFFAGFFHILKRRKTALQLNIKDDNFAARQKKCSRHLMYVRACVNKDFVHNGSIRLI